MGSLQSYFCSSNGPFEDVKDCLPSHILNACTGGPAQGPSGPALRQGSLKCLFQAALYLLSSNLSSCHFLQGGGGGAASVAPCARTPSHLHRPFPNPPPLPCLHMRHILAATTPSPPSPPSACRTVGHVAPSLTLCRPRRQFPPPLPLPYRACTAPETLQSLAQEPSPGA